MTEDTITVKKSTFRILTYVVVILLVGVAFTAGYMLGGTTTGQVVANTGNNNNAAPQGDTNNNNNAPTRVQVSAEDDAVLGSANAPVEIIEFSDYQCPFCRKFWQDTLPQLKTEYIDTGKAKLVVRDFPLSFHPMAPKAAEAAECAGEQNKYFEMHDKMFEEQNKLDGGTVRSTVQFSADDLKKWAADIGLKAEQFNSCLDSGKYTAEVQKDFNDGTTAGVSGTPSFFVNGQQLVGAQPFAAFKQVIDAELAK